MMKPRRTMCAAGLLLLTAVMLTGLSWAEEAQAAGGEAASPPATALAVAPAPAPPPQPKADLQSVAGRVDVLEKENVVLREDLGKTRLSARTELDSAEKRFADAIAKVKRDLREAEEKMEAERKAQAKRNRNFWIAIGALAIALAASD